MCFSATASFVASGLLAGIGIATLQTNKNRSYLMLALTPLLFAIQQAAEGIVWLTIASPQVLLHQTAVYVFLTFAYIIWPMWSPLAMLSFESNSMRRAALWGLATLGIAGSGYIAWLFLHVPIKTHIVSCSIDYRVLADVPISRNFLLALYTLATIVPLFVARLKYGWFLGASWLVALVITLLFKYETTTSVWCFFAALLSAEIFMIIKKT